MAASLQYKHKAKRGFCSSYTLFGSCRTTCTASAVQSAYQRKGFTVVPIMPCYSFATKLHE